METAMRAFGVWLLLAVLAVVNGGFREVVLKPRIGEQYGHVVSSLILCGIILATTIALLPWIGVPTLAFAWAVGFGWVILTLSFEFLAGHYLFGNPWSKILADYNVFQGRVWVMVPTCTVFAPALAWRGIDPQWALPYAISNGIAAAILLAAIGKPHVARWAVVLIFGYASAFNTYLALSRPEEYVNFANFALIPWYQAFIVGSFADHAGSMILAIAIGQGVTALCLALWGRFAVWGGLGVCLFLTGIAPLGVGSAFPFSVFVSLAVLVLLGRERDVGVLDLDAKESS